MGLGICSGILSAEISTLGDISSRQLPVEFRAKWILTWLAYHLSVTGAGLRKNWEHMYPIRSEGLGWHHFFFVSVSGDPNAPLVSTWSGNNETQIPKSCIAKSGWYGASELMVWMLNEHMANPMGVLALFHPSFLCIEVMVLPTVRAWGHLTKSLNFNRFFF